MSSNEPNSPDVWRQRIQLVIAVTLIVLVVAIPAWYVISIGITAEDEMVNTIVIGSWTLAIAGAGAAFSLFGLGRKVS